MIKLKNVLNEADKEWRGGDLIKIKKLIILTRKKQMAYENSATKLRSLIHNYKDHEQGRALIQLAGASHKHWLDRLEDGFKTIFSKAWKAI